MSKSIYDVVCVAGGCDQRVFRGFLCSVHRKRWQRTGSVNSRTIVDQFFSHVTENESGCWVWDKPKPNGYGQFMEGKKSHLPHRWIYTFMVAAIPDGLQIDHLCRNRACVNPYHLEPVPQPVNNARSESPTAVNARKTHCKRGHEFDEANTYVLPGSGSRSCRTCARDRKRQKI